jgi:hypothetical protein
MKGSGLIPLGSELAAQTAQGAPITIDGFEIVSHDVVALMPATLLVRERHPERRRTAPRD